MDWTLPQWGQLITLFIIATAMGMDAFSLGLGIGMRGIRLRQVALVSVTTGFFHMFMPMLGIAVGRIMGVLVERMAVMVGGGLLIFLGINMLVYAWQKNGERTSIDTINLSSLQGLLLFSLSVSLDSLSAGFSMGLFAADIVLASLLFGWVSMLMAGAGLLLGRHVAGWIGGYGEAVGGIILIGLGLRFLM